jgi:hypothetical protein
MFAGLSLALEWLAGVSRQCSSARADGHVWHEGAAVRQGRCSGRPSTIGAVRWRRWWVYQRGLTAALLLRLGSHDWSRGALVDQHESQVTPCCPPQSNTCFTPPPCLSACCWFLYTPAGPEADQFSLATWPDLSRTGGFRVISDKWTQQLPVSSVSRGEGWLKLQVLPSDALDLLVSSIARCCASVEVVASKPCAFFEEQQGPCGPCLQVGVLTDALHVAGRTPPARMLG